MMNEENKRTLDVLRSKIGKYMSGKRLLHTLSVEAEIEKLAVVYAPEKEYILHAAALLHDITKELPATKQLQFCDEFGIMYTEEEICTPKIFHSRTAPALIKRDFPEFADEELLSAVRWHTTGRADMTLPEQLLFLADYIEDTRTFPSCIELRDFFWGGLQSADDKTAHLNDTMILALDMTVRELCEDKQPIHLDTVSARNSFIMKGRLKK